MTDGVFEAKNPQGERWGYETMLDVIRQNSRQPDLMKIIVDYVDVFAASAPQSDDTTLVEMHVHARTPENNRFGLTIPPDARWLAIVRATVAKACELAAFPPTEAGHIVLAVDEACSNIIKYAYKHDPFQKIALTVKVSEGRLEVFIDDEGPQVRLEDLQGRSLDDVRPADSASTLSSGHLIRLHLTDARNAETG